MRNSEPIPTNFDFDSFLLEAAINKEILATNVCWFCNMPDATEETATLIYLHRNMHSTYGLTKNRHEWEEVRRRLPRCQACQKAHDKADKWGKTLMWLGGFMGVSLSMILLAGIFTVFSSKSEYVDKLLGIWFVTFIGGMIGGGIFGNRLGHRIALSSAPDTKPKTYAKEHPAIAPLLEQGWKFDRPDYGQKI